MDKTMPDDRDSLQQMIDRWLLDAEHLRKLASTHQLTHVRHKLTQTADRLGSAAGLLHFTKDEV